MVEKFLQDSNTREHCYLGEQNNLPVASKYPHPLCLPWLLSTLPALSKAALLCQGQRMTPQASALSSRTLSGPPAAPLNLLCLHPFPSGSPLLIPLTNRECGFPVAHLAFSLMPAMSAPALSTPQGASCLFPSVASGVASLHSDLLMKPDFKGISPAGMSICQLFRNILMPRVSE
jgi:hypothetical protein